jgi:PAS domain S-box-containing protein
VSADSQAVLLNAVPLLVLAALYLAVTAALASVIWRERGRGSLRDVALASVFPAVSICALVLGILVLRDRRALGNHIWPSFAAILVALVPAVAFLVRRRDGDLAIAGAGRAREAEERVSMRDRELEAVSAISNALIRAREQDELSAARIVCDEVARLAGVEFVAVARVDEPAGEAHGLVARSGGADLPWWSELRVDLRNEPSGIASAVFEATPVAAYDAVGSRRVSRRLAELVGAKSGAWIPMITGDRVMGVLVLASTDARRAFGGDELEVLQAIASEAGLALERARSAAALGEALERERFVAEISRKVRSELDVDALLRVAVEETGRALGAGRCFIRLGEPGTAMPVVAEWDAADLEPLGDVAPRLPVSNLAAGERRTVVVDDVRTAPEAEPDREALISIGSYAVAASPLLVFDRLIGVLSIHHTSEHAWTRDERSLVEAVARELALELHTGRLLAENARRLEQQSGLLHAAQVLSSELEVDAVIGRLVAEVPGLLHAEAADCYLFDAARGTLRCAAVHGLDPSLVGLELPGNTGLAGVAIRRGAPVASADPDATGAPAVSPAYEGFAHALVAPIAWGDQMRGALGVGTRDPARPFDEADADMLGTLAGLAALALRNAESYGERARQARIQLGFYRIAEVLGEPLSTEKTVAAAAQAACQALGGDHAAVLMPGPLGLALAGAHEPPERLAAVLRAGLPASARALAEAAADRRVLASSRIADDDRFDPEFLELLASAGSESLLAIPIEVPRADTPALALVLFDAPHVFTDDDLELARQVARAASGALERAELYEAERSSRALAQQLARTGALLATELDPAAVIAEVTEQAPALLDVDGCSTRSLEGDELVVSAVSGEELEAVLGARSPSTAWPAGDVVQSRAPVALADANADRRPTDGEPVLAAGHAAYLGVPLFGREGSLHGVLAVYAREARSWREEEVEALSALAANASVALSNAELYQRVALDREQSVAILSNIADGIVAVDREGQIVLWNQAAAQITGVPREEALGRTPLQVLHRELEAEGTGPGGSRLVSIARGGEEIWLSLSEAVMRDPVGSVAGRIFAFRDISSERVVEQMKSDFVSTVSHELRTPLTSIYGFAATLLRQDVAFGDEERRTFLGYIASESERLTTIVDALLNVARLDTGDLHVSIAPTDVAQVVEDAVTTARAAADGDGHRFVLELDDALTAEADAEKLRQIVDQLLVNAVKFSPEGGTVTVVARRRPDAVEVSVVDQGIGISSTDQQRIFSKFYRADAQSRTGGGAGLGLFIAQGLVAAMGGRIWVDSAEGRGSAFTFELPAPAAPLAAPRREGE